MKRPASALYSTYIIDGVQMPQTPAQMLNDCVPGGCGEDERGMAYENIVDETTDPALKKAGYSGDEVLRYVEKVRAAGKNAGERANVAPGSYAKRKIAAALTDVLWKKGHFTLEDLGVRVQWRWNCAPLGNMAAFYFSAEAVGGYLFDLNIRLDGYSFEKSQDGCGVECSAGVSAKDAAGFKENEGGDEYDFFDEREPEKMRYCWISDERKCGDRLVGDSSSWLIYIPFDSCDYRLGDSLFEKVVGASGDKAPDIQDPDYFIDCFEVIRELVEDGVILSGVSVGAGGLLAAAAGMSEGTGLSIDVSGIERAAGEADVVRILFSEVPGVLIQINDDDYDYIDAQMLLQDIAYFPIGHPSSSKAGGLSVVHGKRPGVSSILAALIEGHYSEGED